MRLKNLLSLNNITALVKISFLIFLFLIMLFNRSFAGLYIFGFRLGELLTGVGLLFAMIFFLAPKKYLSDFYFNNLQFYSQKLIFVSFFVVTFLNEGSLLNTYTYKSSSYIWTTSFLFFGVIYKFNSWVKVEDILTYFFIIPFITYVFSSGNYPNVIIDFFKVNSDKFQFLKPSYLFIGYAALNFLMKFIIRSQNRRFLYFLITSFTLLPLLLFSSRGSFLGVAIYMCFEIIYS